MIKRLAFALTAAMALSPPAIAQERPLLDVTSQIAADQARVDLVNSRYDYVLARARLEAMLGRNL
jgi:outer membrane protein TolC